MSKSTLLDSTDRKLLSLLQVDASAPTKSLAAKVGLSTTACWNRIRQLEENGVITGRVALVDPAKLGVGLTVFVSVCTREHSGEWLQSFAEKVAAMPEVVDFFRMAGDVDYMLRVLVPDMDAFDKFYKDLITDTSLSDVTSRFAMESIKQTTAVPIPLD